MYPALIQAGHAPEKLKVGLHSLGYVAESRKAVEEYYPVLSDTFTQIGNKSEVGSKLRKYSNVKRGEIRSYCIGGPAKLRRRFYDIARHFGGIE